MFTVPVRFEYLIDMKSAIESKKAVLDLIGATCTSCAITIEHVGKKFDGISDVFVDRSTSTIQVEYDGNQESLDKLCELVDKIGYEATIKATE